MKSTISISSALRGAYLIAGSIILWCPDTAAQRQADSTHVFHAQEKVIFRDDFSDYKVGAFPVEWQLTAPCSAAPYTAVSPYCIVSKSGGTATMEIAPTPGKETLQNYIQPKMKAISYLPDSFTLEYDFLLEDVRSSADLLFQYEGGQCLLQGFFIFNQNSSGFVLHNAGNKGSRGDEYYMHKAVIDSAPDAGVWHHFALAYNKQKIKCYVDTNEVLYISNCGYIPTRFILSCNNGDRKVMYANIRLATGRFVTTKEVEDFNRLLSEKKLVTHSINFDINSFRVKAKGIAYIKQLAEFLKNHKNIRLEIDGYTDSDGNKKNNDRLSEWRAKEIKRQLIIEGIKAARLTTRGFGSSKPLVSDLTEEGKAANRRVEFVLLPKTE
jgi:outer membrane protein OmpA-like peptidoglycan-associated protein